MKATTLPTPGHDNASANSVPDPKVKRMCDAPLFVPMNQRVVETVSHNQPEKDVETGRTRLRLLRMFVQSELGDPFNAWDADGREVKCDQRIVVGHYIGDLTERLKCGAAFIRECIDKIRRNPESTLAEDLMKKPQGGGAGKPRGDAAPFLKAAILEVVVKRQRRVGSKRCNQEVRAHMLAAAAAAGVKIQSPTAETIRKWSLTDEVKYACESPYFSEHLRQVCGINEDLNVIGAKVQLDTTTFSERKTKDAQTPRLFVVDKDGRSLGPANVIFGVDAAHRGLWTFLAFPGAANGYLAGQAIKRGLMSKDDLLKDAGIRGSWPFHGHVMMINHDNGSEFSNHHVEQAVEARDVGFQEYSPVNTPHFRGKIERMNRTAHQLFTAFVESGKGKRFITEVVDIKGAMGITQVNLERALTEWAVESYHDRPHQGLGGDSPMERFLRLASGSKQIPASGFPRPIPRSEKIDWDFLSVAHAKINHVGITWCNRRYAPGPEDRILSLVLRSKFAPGKRASKEKLEFRYNPFNLGEIFIRHRDPQSGALVTYAIPYRLERSKYPDADERIKTCSLWEWNAWGKKVRSFANKSEPDLGHDLLLRLVEGLTKKGAKTKTERRAAALADHFGRESVTSTTPDEPTPPSREESVAPATASQLSTGERRPAAAKPASPRRFTPRFLQTSGGFDSY